MLGAGGMVSSGGRKLVRLATTGMVLSGLGVAGTGLYGNQIADPRVGQAQSFIQANAQSFIIVGVVLIVLGGILNFVMARRMAKRMTANMGMMGGASPFGAASMPDMNAMRGMMGTPTEVVKVRCPSCGKLQFESAAFCGDCGKTMRPKLH